MKQVKEMKQLKDKMNNLEAKFEEMDMNELQEKVDGGLVAPGMIFTRPYR